MNKKLQLYNAPFPIFPILILIISFLVSFAFIIIIVAGSLFLLIFNRIQLTETRLIEKK